MALDHYIPQCLTRPWCNPSLGKTTLRVFDFRTRKFISRSARKLFARRGINSPALEKFLGDHIESPFALVQDEIRQARGDMGIIKAAINRTPPHVLVGMYWLQLQRVHDARLRQPSPVMTDLARDGLPALQALSTAFFDGHQALIYGVTRAMFFPSTGAFTIPLVDQMPAHVLPVNPAFALVFADRSTDRRALDAAMANDMMPVVCSIGLDCARVVLPPDMTEPSVETMLKTRADLRRMYREISRLGIAVGAPMWTLAEPREDSL